MPSVKLNRIRALLVVDPDAARREILAAFVATRGNAVEAAGKLGISHRTLIRRMTDLGLWADLDAWCAREGIVRQPGPARGPRG